MDGSPAATKQAIAKIDQYLRDNKVTRNCECTCANIRNKRLSLPPPILSYIQKKPKPKKLEIPSFR